MADDDRAWYRDPTKLIPVAVGLITIVTAAAALIRELGPEPAKGNVEYVVDVSGAMNGTIGSKEKLDAVVAEVVEHAQGRPDTATALRLAGGGCHAEYQPPEVSFGRDNGDDIEAALRGVRPRGKSDFAHAVTHAVNDVDRHGGSERTTMVVFVGGEDTCTGPRAASIVRQALRDLRSGQNVDVNFKFVGVKVPPGVRRLLRAAEREARKLEFGADVVIARREEQLADALPDEPEPGETPEPSP